MAEVFLEHVYKVYEGKVEAVRDFCLDIKDREFMVFVGPSGCGKSTTLRMIAGLEEITKGEVRIGDRVVNDVAPKDRDIAMVFQNYALYPHMTVYDNMAFGLKLRKYSKEEINNRVMEAAKILGLEDYLNRRPKQLSGGQRQRVAMGRAIVRKPKVFLFDEPLSNLDAKLRGATRREILLLHKRLGATMLYVTHDQTEALTLADRIVCMSMGYVQQVGTPLELYESPANVFVASFIGLPPMNFFDGEVRGKTIHFDGFDYPLSDTEKALLSDYEGKVITLGVRPENVVPDDTGYVQLAVTLNENLGQNTLVHGTVNGHKLIAKVRDWCTYKNGDNVNFSFSRVHFFDKETTNAIR